MTLAEHHELLGTGETDRNASCSDVGSRYSALVPLSYERSERSESFTKLLNGLPNGSAITFCVDQLDGLWPSDFADATDHYTRMQRVAEACHCSFHINEKTGIATFSKILLSESALRAIVRVSRVPATTALSTSVITVKKRQASRFASLVVVAMALCGAATAVLWKAASQETILPRQSTMSVIAPEKPASTDSPPQSDSTGHGQPEIRVTTVGATSLGNDASLGELRAPERLHQVEAGKAAGAQRQTVPKQQLGARSNRNSAQNSPGELLFRPWWYSWR
jgi:hypothetical protein